MKLLLIDDEAPVREILGLSLRSEGYEVMTAASGKEGIEIFRRENPPIVLTDIKMPGMDGIEVLKKIKQINPETEVIIITGHGDMDLAIQSLQFEIKEMQLFQSKKLAALGTLLAGVAHELNNPLSNISTSCQILLEEIENTDLDFRKHFLKQIEEQTDKARNIIRSLLEFSRQKEFEKETLNLKDIIQETMSFIRGQVPARVEIRVEVPESINIYADKQRIQQAFLNIITNAIQSIPNEGIISIKAEVDEDKGFVNIKFKDTGVGIKPEILPRIFDPFFTTKEVGKGSGLGLFVTHEIIERHGGRITVKSKVGEGTSFLVQLPLRKRAYEQ